LALSTVQDSDSRSGYRKVNVMACCWDVSKAREMVRCSDSLMEPRSLAHRLDWTTADQLVSSALSRALVSVQA